MISLVFHPAAREELQSAAIYYEHQADGLGQELLDTIAQAVDVLQEFPKSGTPLSSHTRRYLIERFPFGLVYTLEHEQLTILAVMHLHRKPGYWRDRK